MRQPVSRPTAAVALLIGLFAALAPGGGAAPVEPVPRPGDGAASAPVVAGTATRPMPRPGKAGRGTPEPGWTLRATPDGERVAVAGGPGQVTRIAAFCLAGAPWLTLDLEPLPEAEHVRVDFGFSSGRIAVEALREAGAGGAYVAELAKGPLARLLAGDDAEATLGIDGTQQGFLSLSGSSHALRGALERCLEF